MAGNNITKPDLGRMRLIDNKDRRFGAALSYMHVRVQISDGQELDLMFTQAQVKDAFQRAALNKEDIPEETPACLDKLKKFLFKLF